jgi:glycerol-3-phosphate dehydrogenase
VADSEIGIVGAGVVGASVALALARRGASVALLEAEPEPGLQASGTNSGILHTGFDSPPGELETELILRAAELRDPVLDALAVPTIRCGATVRPLDDAQRQAVKTLAENARANGVKVSLRDDGTLDVPGEAVTNPVAYTLALVAAARHHGAEVRTRFRVTELARTDTGFVLGGAGGERVGCRVMVNCAGLGAGDVAKLAGDESFEIYPRKGEFLVFDPPQGEPLRRVMLPVPTERTKGVLVFPTVDGKVVAGPTAVDQEDAEDWSVRAQAREEIMPKATRMYPPLSGAEPIAAYAGLRPAGRGVNYLIGPSRVCPGLVNVAAIRSTGLSASLAIGERVRGIVAELGIPLRRERALSPGITTTVPAPWWRRTTEHRAR